MNYETTKRKFPQAFAGKKAVKGNDSEKANDGEGAMSEMSQSDDGDPEDEAMADCHAHLQSAHDHLAKAHAMMKGKKK